MHTFKELSEQFTTRFDVPHFPDEPTTLYEPCNYFLASGGKRARPVMCLMGNELFAELHEDAWHAATAIELFHNFTLIHDDIMDNAALRRGRETVHKKYGANTALLAGDVTGIVAYDYLNKINSKYLQKVIALFNKTAIQVCEGQQLDMDFEAKDDVSTDAYINMIGLKTSVLLAASLQIGAIIGGASDDNAHHLYEFGRNLGIAFQIQDDYLDAFGDAAKFGKDVGGDIKQNKKTFLLLHALQTASNEQKKLLQRLMQSSPADKVEQVLKIYRDCHADVFTKELEQQYVQTAWQHLDAIDVSLTRKEPLKELAEILVQREQ